jgi:hypothetical protein
LVAIGSSSSPNRDGIKSPRGGHWGASCIGGSRARETGILSNEIYIGRIVYNRQTFRKDPETGKRVPRVNPREQWLTVEAPELRIIHDSTWAQAQARKARIGNRPAHQHRRPRRLLSGLLRCGCCGGPYVALDQRRVLCANHRERGTCDNSRRLRWTRVEIRVLSGLKDRLLTPAAVAAFAREVRTQFAQLQGDAKRASADRLRQVEALTGKIRRAVAAIGDGIDTPELRRQLMAWEREKADIEARAEPT